MARQGLVEPKSPNLPLHETVLWFGLPGATLQERCGKDLHKKTGRRPICRTSYNIVWMSGFLILDLVISAFFPGVPSFCVNCGATCAPCRCLVPAQSWSLTVHFPSRPQLPSALAWAWSLFKENWRAFFSSTDRIFAEPTVGWTRLLLWAVPFTEIETLLLFRSLLQGPRMFWPRHCTSWPWLWQVVRATGEPRRNPTSSAMTLSLLPQIIAGIWWELLPRPRKDAPHGSWAGSLLFPSRHPAFSARGFDLIQSRQWIVKALRPFTTQSVHWVFEMSPWRQELSLELRHGHRLSPWQSTIHLTFLPAATAFPGSTVPRLGLNCLRTASALETAWDCGRPGKSLGTSYLPLCMI